MIYLKEVNVLFLKARKVAGTSFEIALSKFAGADDILTPISPADENIRSQLGFVSAQNYQKRFLDFNMRDWLKFVKTRRAPYAYFNHIPAKEIIEKLGAEAFNSAHKVAIVRNPFDVIVSQYYFQTNGSSDPVDIDVWVKRKSGALGFNNDQYFVDGVGVVDQFIRYEHLLDDTLELEKIKPQLKGLSDELRNINAKGNIRPKDATAKRVLSSHPDIVQEIYRENKEIVDKFGYGIDG